MRIDKGKIADACNEAYIEAGHNAYFGNGFQTGVDFAEKQLEVEIKKLLQALKESTEVIKAFNLRHTQIEKNNKLINK